MLIVEGEVIEKNPLHHFIGPAVFQYALLLYIMHGETRLTAGSKSSGLGLVIAKKIIDAHTGIIRMESETGKGGRFCFILPKTLPAAGAQQ